MASLDIDALWLPPDPLFINVHTFAVLKEFPLANSIPLYVPTSGFVEVGAVASVAPSFRQIGATTASVTKDLLHGRSVPAEVYPTECDIAVNLDAARAVGLLESDVRKSADRLFRNKE